MKLLILFFAILIASATSLFAQFDFRPGYVVTSENDTLHGLIDCKGNKANARKCVFRQHRCIGYWLAVGRSVNEARLTMNPCCLN